MQKNIACVLLAAGCGTRFGGNKLLEPVQGTSLIERAATLHAGIPYALRVLVLPPKDEALMRLVETKPFCLCFNPAPENGISGSVRLGLATALEEAKKRGISLDGVLFSVSDQPNLQAATVQRLLDAFSDAPDCIIAPVSAEGRRGNPAVFPATLFSELLRITGDRGGGTVIRAHPDLLLTCPAEALELFDVDTREDADAVETLLARTLHD